MERRAELFEAPEMGEIVELKLVELLPETCYVGALYTLEGTVKLFGIGAPPWIYIEIKKKEWYKPEVIEEVSYERGLPKPISGKFSIDLTFDKVGSYEVTVVATPAPLSLPLVGVAPVVGRSDKMEIEVEEPPPPAFRFASATIDGQMIALVDHDADSALLMRKSTADYLEIMPAFEWTGVRKKVTISIKAGFKEYLGTFAPKTGAFTKSFTLPDSPFTPYEGELAEPIRIPLTACGDIDDGAIEIVAKLPDMPDYITHIWNVYATKIEKKFRFAGVTIDGQLVPLVNHDADSGLLLKKTTADSLQINLLLEWQGPRQPATVSIKAGYKDWTGGFTPKTGAYTRTITFPESAETPLQTEMETPISIPLVACGGLTDGAAEIVLKIADFPDYISHIWNVYATKVPPEELGFDLTRPSVSETHVEPGTAIDITCPITSRCAMPVDAHAKVIIYEGSIMPGHGDKIKEYDSGVFHIEPNESKNFVVHHTTVEGDMDRRDVEVEVYIDTQLVKESEWDDVFYVGVPPEEVVDFDLTRPSVSPAEITPDTEITLTCPVTSVCTKEQTATAKVKIYEGSFYAGHGRLITTKTSPAFTISPEQTYDVIVHHTAIVGDIDRRDVEVEIYVGGKLVKESEWDDVYYVTPEVELELLEIKIDPIGAGTVTVTPEPEKGTQHNWYFPHGTTVHVTAHPEPAYIFKRWSGEMKDTTAITAPVYSMTEKRTITAHFEKEVVGPPKAKIDNVDFGATKGEYSIGDSVPFTCWYDYEGKEQSGQLLLTLGTGVAPAFFPVVAYAPMEITLEEAMRATRRSFTGYFHLVEPLQPGKLYNTQAVLKGVEEFTEDMDRDWSVIRIKEVALEYTLTAIASPSYGGSISGAGKYGAGTYATLYATPASGYEFDRWGGDASGTSRSISVYMDRNKSVTAYFKAIVVKYTLTTSVYPSGAGTVTGAGTYRAGIYATLYATPASGYEFDRWSGDATGISRSVRVYMDRNKRAVANFKKKVVPGFTLTVLMSPTAAAGWVKKEPDKASYTYGETVKLTATSATGYRFSYWTVNGEWAGYSSTLTLMLTTDLEVIAYYTKV